jgi:hypothetical protein
MRFSHLAWCGLGRYFTILDKIGYTRPIRWNWNRMRLERNPKPQKIRWIFGFLISTFNSIILPAYFFLESILSRNYERKISKPQAVTMVACFAAGMFSIPAFLYMVLDDKQIVLGFNKLIDLEHHVHGKLNSSVLNLFG